MSVSYSSRILSAWMRISSRSAWTPISSHSRPRGVWMPISRHSWMPISSRSLSTICLPPQTHEPLAQSKKQLQLQSKKKLMDSPLKKVYMVSPGSYELFGNNLAVSWSIFCVDLESKSESEGFSLLHPKLELCDESFNYAAFCIIESTLYVFEGYNPMTGSSSKSIYSYKLEEGVSNFKLEKHMMDKVGMENGKYFPVAVPTPDRKKILVYSDSRSRPGQFELFNPETGTCQKLPPLNCDESFQSIVSHTFLSTYVLLVKVDHGKHWGGKRSYVLDFQLPPAKRSWKPWKEGSRYNEDVGQSLIFGNDLCLTAREGLNFDDEFSGCFYLYPEISSLPEDKLVSADCSFITLIEEDGDVCKFCILHKGIKKEDEFKYVPHIILDVYSCDVNVCREEMKRINELRSGDNKWKNLMLPGVKKIKSLRFCMEPDDYDHIFGVLSFSTYN